MKHESEIISERIRTAETILQDKLPVIETVLEKEVQAEAIIGKRGLRGYTGEDGIIGPQGPHGERGPEGPQGDPGRDAPVLNPIDLLNDRQFKKQFIELIKKFGPQGPRGEKGSDGLPGIGMTVPLLYG